MVWVSFHFINYGDAVYNNRFTACIIIELYKSDFFYGFFTRIYNRHIFQEWMMGLCLFDALFHSPWDLRYCWWNRHELWDHEWMHVHLPAIPMHNSLETNAQWFVFVCVTRTHLPFDHRSLRRSARLMHYRIIKCITRKRLVAQCSG